MVSSREEAIELLLTMSDITKEIAELMKGEAVAPPVEKKKELSLEEVRAELSKLSRAGKTAVVRKLLADVGAAKLSEVDPSKYWLLMAQAQEANGEAAHAQ